MKLFMSPRGAVTGLLLPLFLLVAVQDGDAQDWGTMVASCGGESSGFEAWCHQAALSLDAARGGLATSTTLGSEVPGSASTLGYRLGGIPRSALSARVGFARFSVPQLGDSYSLPAQNKSVIVPAVHISGIIALLNGFSPVPTVGGVLSVDLTTSAHHIIAPEGDGFQGGLTGFGIGARVGIIRESFTLPGVSLSVARRWMGQSGVGDMTEGGPAQAEFDLNLTSIRAVVGKDIFGIGVLAGGGWDRAQGEGSVRAKLSPMGPETMASSSDLVSDRMVLFASGSLTFLVIQLSAEAGWSRSLDSPLALEPGSSRFPSNEAYFGSLAFRITI